MQSFLAIFRGDQEVFQPIAGKSDHFVHKSHAAVYQSYRSGKDREQEQQAGAGIIGQLSFDNAHLLFAATGELNLKLAACGHQNDN